MSKIKSIVFDWDGVLADTLWILEEIYATMCAHFGARNPPQGTDHFDVDWKHHWTVLGFGDRLKEVQALYLKESIKYEGKTKLFPGIAAMLDELGKRTKIAMLTNNYAENILPILEQNNVHMHFAFIHDAHHEHTKPDPHIITLTAERLGITPAEMIFVGDMDKELEMARKAGVGKVIACAYGYHSEKRLAPMNPDKIVYSPQELRIALLEALHG